ncbi:MAG: hypothetical protein H7258_02335, partial [Ferruginibacter sp.]|nr:hypothetical protein [Ferruginibacter sp.]
ISDISASNGVWHNSTGHFKPKVRKPAAVYWDVCAFPEVMNLPAYYIKKVEKDNFGSSILNSDSIMFKGSDNIKDILTFDNYLMVRYLNEPEPIEFSGQFMDRKSQHFQVTNFIILNDEKSILIRPDGYYFPSLDLLIEGYLGWEKIGDLLPLDYYPAANN